MKNHSSKNTSEFYDELVKGKKKFTFFSNETRFNIENILNLNDEASKKSKLILINYFLKVSELVFKCLGIETVEEM